MKPTAFSQHDSRWTHQRVGAGKAPFHTAGCLVCTVASALVDLGIETDPARLNQWLQENAGFFNENLLIWTAVEPLGVRLNRLINCVNTPAPLAILEEDLAARRVVLAQVDAQPGGPLNQHWVRLLSCDPAPMRCRIMDPWQPPGAELINLGQYATSQGWNTSQSIFKAAIYCRNPSEDP